MNYNIVAIVFIALGFGLLFLLDTLIAKDSQYELLQIIRQNNLIIGVVCLGIGYYVYTLGQKQTKPFVIETTELNTSEPLAEAMGRLPSYEEATSTDEILNM
jgi:predicted membrane channel-forming protein YqfA (hemolysin III family)